MATIGWLILPALAAASPQDGQSANLGIPNGNLRVAARQFEDGEPGTGVHLFEVSCWDGRCTLTTVSLNQCIAGAFYPKVEQSSTQDGSLRVTNLGDVLVLEVRNVDLGGDSITNLRLGYAVERSTMLPLVTSFSGGFVKNSEIAKRVLTVQYIPVKGPNEVITLDCPVELPGVMQW
jgi:hypothetical protein